MGGPWEDFQPQAEGPWTEFKRASSAPIGDLPPDFGSAQVKPSELSDTQRAVKLPAPGEVLPGLGSMFADNLKSMANPAAPFMGLAGTGAGGDVARTVASKLVPVAPIGSGLAGIATGLGNELIPAFGGTPDKSAADAANEAAQALSYEPKTGLGKAVGGAIDVPFDLFGKLTGAVGQKTLEGTGSPLAATAVDAGLQMLPFLFGGHEAVKAGDFKASLNTEAAGPKPPTAADSLKSMADGIKTEIDKALQPQQQPPQQSEVPRGTEQRAEASPVAQQPGASSPAAVPDRHVIPVSESADAPVGRPTPGVDKSGDVPLAGGVVKPTERATGHVAIDKDVPQWIKVPEHTNEAGETFPESWVDQHQEIKEHEDAEEPNIAALGYQDAHDIHGNAATDDFARRNGMDPAVYKKAQAESVKAAETKAEQGKATDVNPALDTRPYEDSNKTHLLPDFTAEQRRVTAAKAMADKVSGLTDEQRAQIEQHYPEVTKDRVTGFDRAEELDPTIESVQKAGGGAYGEVDVRNLGGLNAHSGSNAKANVHLKAVADILREEAAKAGGNVSLIRKSAGDEFGVVAHGMDSAALSGVLERARGRIEEYAKANGLDQIPHSKGGQVGFGIHYGTSDIAPGASIRDILVHADSLVEQRKAGAPYEQRAQTEAVGAGQGSEGAVARTAPQDAAGGGAADRTGEAKQAGSEVNADSRNNAPHAEMGNGSGGKPESTVSPNQRDSSVRNAATAVDRATHGLDPLEAASHKPWDESKAEAAKAIAADPDYAKNLAREVLKSKRPITDAETMALGAERQRLEESYAANDDAILKAREAGDTNAEVRAMAQKSDLESQMDMNHRATQAGGTELARAMAARNAQMVTDYSTARTLTRARVAYGEKFNPAVEKQVRELTEKLAETEKRVAELEQREQKTKLDANAKEQARLQKQISDMETKLAKRVKVCPI